MKTFARHRFAGILAATLLLFALAACDGDGGSSGGGSDTVTPADTHEEHDPLAETAADGCVHLQTGPFVAVTVGAAQDATAPLVALGHQAHTVTLSDVGGPGWLRVVVDEDAEVLVALTAVVTLTVRTEASPEAPILAESQPDLRAHCAAMAFSAVFDLAPGTYYLGLAPSAAGQTEVDLFLSEVGEHDEHEHEE
jgi:hypothetical protein